MRKLHFVVVIGILSLVGAAWSYSTYVGSIPNGSVNSCDNCHNMGSNPFRTAFANNNHTWNSALAAQDSDGDNATNGVELEDPQGNWHPGLPNPTIGGWNVYNPNTNTSVPPYAAVTPQTFGRIKALFK